MRLLGLRRYQVTNIQLLQTIACWSQSGISGAKTSSFHQPARSARCRHQVFCRTFHSLPAQGTETRKAKARIEAGFAKTMAEINHWWVFDSPCSAYVDLSDWNGLQLIIKTKNWISVRLRLLNLRLIDRDELPAFHRPRKFTLPQANKR